MRILEKIGRCIRKRKLIRLLKKCEHDFCYKDVRIKYLYIPQKQSNDLVVVFSGMNPRRPSYNYINLLEKCSCNRLYILDDIGHSICGCYYLGTNGHNQVEKAVNALIKNISEENCFSKLIFAGSSKGGYAAINFGLNYSNSIIIAGAPQYRLGYYLTHRKSSELLQIICGENEELYINHLDTRLQTKLKESTQVWGGKMFLHYSDSEHTFSEHIEFLLSDLQQYNYNYEEDRHHYTQHDDVATVFPPYFLKTLQEIL